MLFSITFFTIIITQITSAQPTGIEIINNITETSRTINPQNRTDQGGTITTLVIDVLQQNTRWKAYIGTMSGTLTLDDALGNSIFRWELEESEIEGEIYITRNINIDWSLVSCPTQTTITTENTYMGFSPTAADSIQRTFNETIHPPLLMASATINLTNCPATSTFVNNTKQAQGSASFPIILIESGSNLIYVTHINNNKHGYASANVDFQAIVPDRIGTTTTYYFYAEIGA